MKKNKKTSAPKKNIQCFFSGDQKIDKFISAEKNVEIENTIKMPIPKVISL